MAPERSGTPANPEGAYDRAILGTTSGDTTIDGFVRELTIDTKSGDIKVVLPADTPLHVEAESSSGDIRCNFDQAHARVDGDGRGSELSYERGAASCDVELETSSGTIRLESR